MNDFLNKLITLFNQRSERERLLITLILITGIFFLWLLFLFSPLSNKINGYSEKINVAKKNIATLNALHHNYQALIQSPTDSLEKKMGTLEKKLLASKNHPLLLKKIILKPDDLREVLQLISKMPPLLSLQEVQTLSSVPANPSSKTPYFSEKIQVLFSGNYFETIAYLQYLESLPWFLSFDSLEYHVTEYPNANVKVIINVLSEIKITSPEII